MSCDYLVCLSVCNALFLFCPMNLWNFKSACKLTYHIISISLLTLNYRTESYFPTYTIPITNLHNLSLLFISFFASKAMKLETMLHFKYPLEPLTSHNLPYHRNLRIYILTLLYYVFLHANQSYGKYTNYIFIKY